ncbi:response regulator transcription factor [Streptomyces sp. RMIT01]
MGGAGEGDARRAGAGDVCVGEAGGAGGAGAPDARRAGGGDVCGTGVHGACGAGARDAGRTGARDGCGTGARDARRSGAARRLATVAVMSTPAPPTPPAYTPPARIVDAVRRVAAGDPVLSPAVTRRLMARAAGGGPDGRADRTLRARRRFGQLAEREQEVAVAVAVGGGGSNAEIAASLYLSVATVKTHVSRILAKLGLNNRVQIALLVHDAGLLDTDDGRGSRLR